MASRQPLLGKVIEWSALLAALPSRTVVALSHPIYLDMFVLFPSVSFLSTNCSWKVKLKGKKYVLERIFIIICLVSVLCDDLLWDLCSQVTEFLILSHFTIKEDLKVQLNQGYAKKQQDEFYFEWNFFLNCYIKKKKNRTCYTSITVLC